MSSFIKYAKTPGMCEKDVVGMKPIPYSWGTSCFSCLAAGSYWFTLHLQAIMCPHQHSGWHKTRGIWDMLEGSAVLQRDPDSLEEWVKLTESKPHDEDKCKLQCW